MKRWGVLAGLLLAGVCWAQREWVELERARARLALAREELRRVEALAAEGLVAEAELGRKQAELRLAELDFRDALWQLQGTRLRVVVADSVRTPGPGGLDHITLTLALPQLGVPPGEGDGVEPQLGVADLQVSLEEKGVVVGFPYAHVVPYLAPGRQVQLTFQLLRPVETPTVALEYRGSRQEITLYPRVAIQGLPFRLNVAQPSLAVVFGEEARFQLFFEPLQPQAFTVDLAVRGLPAVCLWSFRDRQSQATVAQLRLGAGSGPREVELNVKLPPGPVGEVRPDSSLTFAVVASYQGKETLQQLRIFPTGVPKLELRAASWLAEVAQGKETALGVEVVNQGTAPGHELRVDLESPAELEARVVPPVVEKVGVGERARFTIWLRARATALAGEYTVRLQPKVANRVLAQHEGESQLRVRVQRSRSWIWPAAFATLLGLGAAVGLKALRRLRLD